MQVLVIGAGIAGLSAARALGQAGIGCDVVEQEQDWTRDGTGIYLPANATRAMRLLGLETLAADRVAVIRRQRFLDHRGRLLLDVDLSQVWGTEDPCVATTRATLHEVLREGLTATVRLGVTVASLRHAADRVEVSFDDGTTRPYDLVIGADGIRSSTRRLMRGGADDESVRPVGQLAWRFVTECPAQVSTWSVMLGHRSTFLAIPIGAGQVYCYADVSAAGAEQSDLAPHFTAYDEPVGELLASVDAAHVHRAPIEEVVLEDWVFGRAVVVGDAAHATSPNMAQGAAMAMEDGLVLARCLTEAPDIDAGLAQFQQLRRPRTEWVRDQTHRRDHTRNLPTIVRNTALRLAGQRIFRANYAPLLPQP